jgi:hypothetical protein
MTPVNSLDCENFSGRGKSETPDFVFRRNNDRGATSSGTGLFFYEQFHTLLKIQELPPSSFSLSSIPQVPCIDILLPAHLQATPVRICSTQHSAELYLPSEHAYTE